MSKYFIAKDGVQSGPFEESEVLRQVAAGLLSTADLCWREGMGDWEPIAGVLAVPPPLPLSSPPPIPVTTLGAIEPHPLFLNITIARLILMSIASFGLYERYWIYKNWRYVKERDNLNIRPFWRAVFGILYCHSLLLRIHGDNEARSIKMPTFSPRALATGWVVLSVFAYILARAPDMPTTIISALIPSYLCFIPVQKYINSVSQLQHPKQPYYRWSSAQIVCLVLGLCFWILVLVGLATK